MVLCGFVCVCVYVCLVSFYVCDIKSEYQQKKPITYQISVNLTRCCVKYTAKSFLYLGIKAWYVYIHNIIK